jgi:hypothetical protein
MVSVVIDNTPTTVVSWIKVPTSGPWDLATQSNPIGVSINGNVYHVIGTQSDGNIASGGRMLLTSTPVAAADNRWGLVATLVAPLGTVVKGSLSLTEPAEIALASLALDQQIVILEGPDVLHARGRVRPQRVRERADILRARAIIGT